MVKRLKPDDSGCKDYFDQWQPRPEEGWICQGHGHGPVANIHKAIERILARADLPHGQSHDWRRTAGTRMALFGVSREVLGRILNHGDGSVIAVYDRPGYDAEKRKALKRWENNCAGSSPDRDRGPSMPGGVRTRQSVLQGGLRPSDKLGIKNGHVSVGENE